MSDAVSGVTSINTLANLSSYWKDMRIYYDGNDNIEYICRNHVHKATTAIADWAIWKLTYSGDNISRMEGPLTGSVDNRATLSWA
jgi:hypothetical protein